MLVIQRNTGVMLLMAWRNIEMLGERILRIILMNLKSSLKILAIALKMATFNRVVTILNI